MAFLLGPALGALGSLLFKEDGGRVGAPAMKSAHNADTFSRTYVKIYTRTQSKNEDIKRKATKRSTGKSKTRRKSKSR
jgi:hypothetical protein